MKQDCRPIILCVDDEPTNLRLLMEILKDDYHVYLAPSGERALTFLQSKTPDLILLDVEMPQMNGYEVIRIIKSEPKFRDIPIIFLTGLDGRDKEQIAFELGAVDYILKPISAGVVKARAGLHIELETYRRNLEEQVVRRTNQLMHTQDCVLEMLANMTSYRDQETGGHIKRTGYYTEVIVDELLRVSRPGYMLGSEYATSIKKSAKLHDIGKVSIADSILLKPARLTPEEFEVIKMHTVIGAQIVDNAIDDLGETSAFLEVAREIIIAHHEKWDGTGYPHKLAGVQIPLSARIMAVVDVYDALISRRPYKEPYSHKDSLAIIRNDTGTHFDPSLIALCEPVFPRFEEIALEHQDEVYDLFSIQSLD
ncbi:MAG: response regulator [Oscillospiraceae bacterium]|nr:response regulator [Oscillospiraceae bacterium]